MGEKRNYVVYTDEVERIVRMTVAQAEAISWFIEVVLDIDGGVTCAENYEGEEI